MQTDEEIIRCFFSLDESAITATSQKYGRKCYAVSFNILCVKEGAEECINETYLRTWNAIHPERPDDFKCYLMKIVRNVSLNRLKSLKCKKRSQELEISFSELENILPDNSVPPEFDIPELTEVINDFVDTPNHDDRIIFLRRYWHMDSIAQISAGFGFGQSKVKISLMRTREKLKKYLQERGIKV